MEFSRIPSLTVLFFSSITAVSAQEYRSYESRADSLYNQRNFIESARLYVRAIQLGASHPNVFYNAACTYALSGNNDSAFVQLGQAVERGFTDDAWMDKDQDLVGLCADRRWDQLVAKLRVARERYEAGLNRGLLPELAKMRAEDQALRQQMISQPDTVLGRQLAEVDERNTARMKEIIEKLGWPGKSLVGDEGAEAAWLLVQHADLDREFQKKCLKLLLEAARKGEVSMRHVAYLTDRVLTAEGKKQIYGTQFETRDGVLVPFPIEDETNVDKRREEVGLPPLEESKKMMKNRYKPQGKD